MERRRLPEATPNPGGPMIIPRVFHRIWFGPERRYHVELGTLLAETNPSWTVMDWRADALALPWVLPHRDAIDRALEKGKWSMASDLLRLVILLRMGGLYVDSDVEAVAPVDPVVSGRDPILLRETRYTIQNCVLGATAGHPLLRRTLEVAEANVLRHNAVGKACDVTGPTVLTEAYWREGGTYGLVPTDAFSPFGWAHVSIAGNTARHRMARGEEPYPEGTVLVHHSQAFRTNERSRSPVVDQTEV